MTICKEIKDYMDFVESGKIRSCKEQKALVRLVRNVLESGEVYVDAERLKKYVGLSKYFPWDQIFPWQTFVLGLHDCTFRKDNGMPRWPTLFCLIGRGAGKDGMIAWESVALASQYNGIPRYDVDICANNEEQAMRPLTEDIIGSFENPSWEKVLRANFYWTKEMVKSKKTGAYIKGHTNNPKGRDGLRSGIVILNEIHQYENYGNIDVFTTGLGKKKHPRMSYYTTDGNVRGGPLDDLKEQSRRILFEGEPDEGFLPFICKLDDKDEVMDPANWEKANPSLPYLPNLQAEIKREFEIWKRNPMQLPAFMTKRMNLPVMAEETQVTDYENIKATDAPLPDLSGWSCVVGIDYSKITDWASVDLHFRDGDKRYDINHSWMCRNSRDIHRLRCPWQQWAEEGRLTIVDDVEIHPSYITDYIQVAKEKYDILGVAIDDFRYALMSSALREIGFSAKEYKNVKLVRPSDIMRAAPVIDSCFANQNFVWGKNPVLKWATNNTKLVPYGRNPGKCDDADIGNFVYGKIEAKSRKTDPFMALVAAMTIEDQLPDAQLQDTSEFLGVYAY